MERAKFQFDVLENFLLIEDLKEPNALSVTNDIEYVSEKIYEELGKEMETLNVLYKDTADEWDGIKFKYENGKPKLQEWVILSEKDLEEAIFSYLEKTEGTNKKEVKTLFE